MPSNRERIKNGIWHIRDKTNPDIIPNMKRIIGEIWPHRESVKRK